MKVNVSDGASEENGRTKTMVRLRASLLWCSEILFLKALHAKRKKRKVLRWTLWKSKNVVISWAYLTV